MNPIFNATVKNGKVVFHNREMLDGYLLSLNNKEVEVVIKKKKKSRTNPQNAYYWSCVVAIPAEHFGYTPDEMHMAFRYMFLQQQEKGKPVTVRSTTTLTTKEFSDYVEQCRHFCAEQGLYIPDPNEVDLEPDRPVHQPNAKEIKEHHRQLEKEKEERKLIPVSKQTLDEIFGWVGKPGITIERIMQLSKENFQGREPKELTQDEAEQLDTIIVGELPL